MQISSILGLAAALSLSTAIPTGTSHGPVIEVTFLGAAGAQYSLDVPLDSEVVYTNNALSISQISSSFDIPAHCTLHTVDQTPVLVGLGPDLWNVGPPETVISIACSGGAPPAKRNVVQSVLVEFDGAAGASYSLWVPLNGAVIPTNNALSISNIETTFADLPSCNIVYVDHPAALVNTAPNTWAVGPPQTILSIQCY